MCWAQTPQMDEWLQPNFVSDRWVVKAVKRLNKEVPIYPVPATRDECSARQLRLVLFLIIFCHFWKNEKERQTLPLCVVERVRATFPDDAFDVQAQQKIATKAVAAAAAAAAAVARRGGGGGGGGGGEPANNDYGVGYIFQGGAGDVDDDDAMTD